MAKWSYFVYVRLCNSSVSCLRIERTDKAGTVRYVFDLDGNIIEEHRGDELIRYVFRRGKHLAKITPDGTYYYGTDRLGSTTVMFDGEGSVVWQGDVSPFGELVSSEGSIEERVKFTGKDYDEAAGLYYFNARWYDAELGRFTTEDPARDGLNWYVYVRNNPLRFVDPTGLFEEEIEKAVNNHLDEEYVRGTNDCDIWVEKVLKEAGVDLPEEWKDAKDTTVEKHREDMKYILTDKPSAGTNIGLSDEGHAILLHLNEGDDFEGASVEVAHNSSISEIFDYDNMQHFNESFAGTYTFWSVPDSSSNGNDSENSAANSATSPNYNGSKTNANQGVKK